MARAGNYLFLLLIALPCCLAARLSAQQQTIQFHHFTEADGLPAGTITSIAEDRQGYIWVGTQGGLARYDGYQFTHFRPNSLDSTSIRCCVIEWLYVDREGMLWIGLFNERAGVGLDRFDPTTGIFTHFVHDPENENSIGHGTVHYVYEDRSGTVWVGLTSNGLDRFERETGVFTHYRHDPEDPSSLSSNAVRVVLEDSYGELWIGAVGSSLEPGKGGLNRLNRDRGTFERYVHDPDDEYSLIDDRVRRIYEDSKGSLWVGTSRNGLHRYDRERDIFIRITDDAQNPKGLRLPRLRGKQESRSSFDFGVTAIHEDASGMLWIGSFEGGLNRYDPVTSTTTHYEPDPNNPNSLSDITVWRIIESRDGSIWFATWGGLDKIDPTPPLFQNYAYDPTDANSVGIPVTSLHEDRSGMLWVGHNLVPMQRLNRDTGTFISFPIDSIPAVVYGVGAIYEDRSDNLWVAWEGEGRLGLNLFDREKERFVSLNLHYSDSYFSFYDYRSDIFEDSEGTLWIGTREGLFRYDHLSGTLTQFGYDADLDADNAYGFSGSAIGVIHEDRNNVLWIGTSGGLDQFDRETETIVPLLVEHQIESIFEDEDGSLWLGTGNSGLLRYDPETGTHTTFTTSDGLPANAVRSILQDGSGNLWLSTKWGLSKFDRDKHTFQNFDTSDGIITNQFSIAATRGRNGTLYFGGNPGITAVSPDRPENANPPEVIITGLSYFNRQAEPGSDAPLRQPISLTEEIELEHAQNDLTFAYVGLHYQESAKNQYEYMLEGYEEAWHEVGTQRTADFTNLNAGEYVFRVKAANSDGVWNEEGASLKFTILPPWWRTWWAYLLYGLLLVAGVNTVSRFQHKRIIARERLRAEREKAKAIESTNNELQRALKYLTETQDQLIHTEKMASLGQLTAGIAHEIKNPLNFVNNFAQIAAVQAGEIETILEKEKERLNTDSAHELKAVLDDLKLNAQKINEHGQRADGIIRSMLEHSRTGRGERRPIDINKLVDEYVNLAYHGVRARADGFTAELEQNYDEAVGEVEIYPQEIGRVLINLLDNAFYAINEKRLAMSEQYSPQVSVNTKKAGGYIEVRIGDNGAGIPGEIQDKIFEPFFTTKPTGSGTGLGLSLSHDIIVKGHGGNLAVESEDGQGATFVISIPINNV